MSTRLRQSAWCTGVFLAGVLLHLGTLSSWMSIIALGCSGWALAAAAGRARLPGRAVKQILVITLTIAVLLFFHTLNGLAAGTALLVVMGSVKLLEANRRRDRLIVIGAALFLLASACLESQSLPRVPLYALHAWACCAALAVVANPGSSLTDRAAVRLAGASLAMALPLAAMLFVFFPRLAGGFWAFPKGGQAMTGLSEQMSPGSISDLTDSNDPVLRVTFEGAAPPPEERYWRGPVLHDFDGYTWTVGSHWGVRNETVEPQGRTFTYRTTLEPSSRTWWLALDSIDAAPARARVTFDRQLVGLEPVTQPLTYRAHSHTRTRSSSVLPLPTRNADLNLPRGRNLKARALGQRLRAAARSPDDFIARVLEMFRTGGYEYSLTPPRTDLDSVDDFLFNTRSGFCGHYASAFVTLMRAGGVPARVVSGYLGGEWNPYGGYFIVRQSDAHAWAEVWVEGSGWRRIDPTGVVAPERLQRGILDLLPNAVSASERLLHRLRWLAALQQSWDATKAFWDTQVVGFDFSSQMAVLQRLGVPSPSWPQLAWALAAALAVWLAWAAWQFGRLPRAARPDRIARAYQRLCGKLGRAGLARLPHQGPLGYAGYIAARRPDLAQPVGALLARYAELRFGAQSDVASLEAFERAVARFRLRARGSRES